MGNLIDLTGKKFGKLTVISQFTIKNSKKLNCICECGRDYVVSVSNMKKAKTVQCAACTFESINAKNIGKKFGSWEVIGFEKSANGRVVYECKCKCGFTKKVNAVGNTGSQIGKKCKKCQDRKRASKITVHGIELSSGELAELACVSVETMARRIKKSTDLKFIFRKDNRGRINE